MFVLSDNIISSLGFTTADNIHRICCEQTGIGYVEPGKFSQRAFPFALVNDAELNERAKSASIPEHFTRLERMMLLSIINALNDSGIDPSNSRCLFVISTTKGNITRLISESEKKINNLGERIRSYFGNPNRAIVVSNACISGALAVEISARFLRTKNYDHVVVAGGDLTTHFVVSGFEALHALSPNPCRPYDANRDGLTLGEGCAAMTLSACPPMRKNESLVVISGGASSCDAVHISAPDRTGAGLNLAIARALESSRVQAKDIDAVCAHGTATAYNDDMESHAMHLAKLAEKPIYSLKGYWGHTLGAAGLMETIAAIHSLKQQRIFKTLGFETHGTAKILNIVKKTENANIKHVLKTASGFGGCNVALIVSI